MNEAKTHELLARFMISQGIPYDAIDSGPLQDLLRHLKPGIRIPNAHMIEQSTLSLRMQRGGQFHGVRGVVVTYDVFGGADEDKYLVFSVHFIAAHFTRKNLVYMRKIPGSKINTRIILETIRAIIKSDQYAYAKISTIVTPNEKLAQFTNFTRETAISKFVTCFYHFITLFADRILIIEQFFTKIQRFRHVVEAIRSDADSVAIFTRVEPSLGTSRSLPSADSGGWQSTLRFLSECISVYEELSDFAKHYNLLFNLSHEEFLEVKFFHAILEQCRIYAESVSGANSCISQVIPTIMLLRRFIFNHAKDSPFKEELREVFASVFKRVTSGEQRQTLDIATLLDPRYGYRKDLYSEAVWQDIEKRLAAKIYAWGQTGLSVGNRLKQLEAQINSYHQICVSNRLAEHEDAMEWWNTNQHHCPRVAAMAHELFLTPAVSIDASYFFGDGGKFNHLLHEFSSKHSELCLEMAGYSQPFRGRGLNHSEQSSCGLVELVSSYKRKAEVTFNPSKKLRASHPPPAVSEDPAPEEQKPSTLLLSASIKEEVEEQPGCSIAIVKQEEPEDVEEPLGLMETVKYEEPDLLSGCWEHKPSNAMLMAPIAMASAPEASSYDQAPVRSSRSDRRHYCVFCGQRQLAPFIRHVKIDSEKLVLCIAAVHLQMIELEEAREFYCRNQIVVCRKHFVEFSQAFFEHLRVNRHEDLRFILDRDLKTLMKISTDISMQLLPVEQFRSILIIFTRKNFNLSARRAFRATDIRIIDDALTTRQRAPEVPAGNEYADEEMEDSIYE